MGLFDNFSLDNLDDPKNASLLAMGLSMMSPKPYKTSFLGNVGESGLVGLQTLNTAKQQERANRQADLTNLMGLQQSIYSTELPKMLTMGNNYVPPPELAAINKRINELAVSQNLSGATKKALAANVASAPAPAPAPDAAPPAPPPVGQNFMGANPNYQPPQGASQPPPQAPPQAPQGVAPPPQGAVPTDVFGVPLAAFTAAGYAKNQGATDFLKALVDARKPVNARPGGTVYGYDPKTGQNGALFYAPKLGEGMQPGAGGQVSAMPGYTDALSAIEGTKASASTKGKQAETYVDVPIGNGQTMRMTNAQYEASRAAGRLTGYGSPPIPQSVIDADKGGPFTATQAPGGPVQFQQGGPGVAKVTPMSAGGGGGLGVTPNPVAQAGALADVESGAKNRQTVMMKDYQNLAEQTNNAQTVVSRLQTIKQLGPQAITGAESEKRDFFNGLLSLVGVKSATDAKTAGDLVDKNAAQIALAIGAGSNGTDALRALAQVANPSRHMTVEAMQRASDSLIAPLQMTLAKGQMLTPHFARGDAETYLTRKQAFEQGADPRIWELQGMPAEQQKAYVSSMSPQDAQQLLQKRALLKQLGVIK